MMHLEHPTSIYGARVRSHTFSYVLSKEYNGLKVCKARLACCLCIHEAYRQQGFDNRIYLQQRFEFQSTAPAARFVWYNPCST